MKPPRYDSAPDSFNGWLLTLPDQIARAGEEHKPIVLEVAADADVSVATLRLMSSLGVPVVVRPATYAEGGDSLAPRRM